MSGIDISGQFEKVRGFQDRGEERIVGQSVKWDRRKIFARGIRPINNSPINGGIEIQGKTFESLRYGQNC
jgi:hypothetical protein